jgi:iron complex outermembrane receptor protein
MHNGVFLNRRETSNQLRFNSCTACWMAEPGLLEGYGIRTIADIHAVGAALFGQLDWQVTDRLHILPGCYNYDKKESNYDRQTYGGLQTNDPQLLAIKEQCTPTKLSLNKDKFDFSGNITVN